MKTIYRLFLMFTLLICLSGCGTKEQNMKCQFDTSQQNYKMKTIYNIYYIDDNVTKVKSEITISSNDSDLLEKFKSDYSEYYEKLKTKYNGYDYDIQIKDNELIIIIDNDYKEFDLNKFINDNSAMKKYVDENNQFTINGAKEYYESIGSKCK